MSEKIIKPNAHCPVIRVETRRLYSSLSEASIAMGRYPGYVSEHLKLRTPCVDVNGEVWTFEQFDRNFVPVRRETQKCYVEEISGVIFKSAAEASRAIGRYPGYIKETLRRGKVLTNSYGRVVHFHYCNEEDEDND